MSFRRRPLVVGGMALLTAPSIVFSQSDSVGLANVFLKALRDLGHVEGGDVVFEWRYADGKVERLSVLAAELVGLNVDVIVTEGTPGVAAARRATAATAIVATSFADPVSSGFAASLGRPGGNVTGLANLAEETVSKRLELPLSVAPKVSRIAWLVNPNNQAAVRAGALLEAAALRIGKTFVPVEVRAVGDLDDAFARMARERVEALIVAEEATLNSLGAQIAGLALRQRLPSMFGSRKMPEAGGLMSFGAAYAVRHRSAATYVDKILKGAKAGDLPIELPREFELVINLSTAKALGIKIPNAILLQVTEVIQ